MPSTAKRIAIIGSTGSIGRQTLEIVRADAQLRPCALAAGTNWRLLAEQAAKFRPEVVAVAEISPAEKAQLTALLPPGTALLTGPDAAEALVRRAKANLVLTALVGSAGLGPTLAAIECGCDLAIANKETLVMGGAIVMPAARAAGVKVLPVDSEHSAIFQCLQGQQRPQVRRITLTASGGPFRDWPIERMQRASVDDALNHPTWQMGRKITIDSATLMNKALEVIEAHWLFDLAADQIDVVIHPQSIVHGLVEFTDGSLLAQMGTPSMATPIGFAIYHPRRADAAFAPLDLKALSQLNFRPVDRRQFPALQLGYDVIAKGGSAGAVLNGANEMAVEAFLAGRIAFGQIVPIVQQVLNTTPVAGEVDIGAISAADRLARSMASDMIGSLTAGRGTDVPARHSL